jgi:hypothetical protein
MFRWIFKPLLTPEIKLTGRWLITGRFLAISVAIASLILFTVALPTRAEWLRGFAENAELLLTDLSWLDNTAANWVIRLFPQFALMTEVAVVLLYFLSAILLYSLRSDDWLALITVAGLSAFALHITPTLHTWMGDIPDRILVGSLAKGIGLGLAFLFLYLFPGGYYAPKIIRVFFLLWVLWVIFWVMNPDSLFSFRDPYTISVPGFVLLMLWWCTGIFSQIYRYYRVSGPEERQQTKLITFGATIVVIGYSLYVPLRELMKWSSIPELAQVIFYMVAVYVFLLMVAAIPVTITFSIMKYRLWDIDLVIRKTLIYGALTLLIALFYLTSVILLQIIFTIFTGQQSTIAVAISTLLSAALFNPLRLRLHKGIDRRFFRSKYDAQQTLETFAAFARNEADLERLKAELVRVTQETLQPEGVGLWLLDYKAGKWGGSSE